MRADRKSRILKGYCESWSNEHKRPSDDGIKEYSTATRWEQYQAGTITREQAADLAIKRAMQDIDKREARKLKLIELGKAAPTLGSLSISVEWKRSQTWGANPTATVRAYSNTGEYIGEYEGHASGCGYDKESAAIAEALNKCNAALYVLYVAENKRLKMRKAEGKDTSRREVIGYASGYGCLPYFEGGCGYSCFEHIFQKLGFKTQHTGSGKMYDSYYIHKEGKR